MITKEIDGKEKQLFTYEELQDMALKFNVKPNKVSVGIWAKINGYKKVRLQKDKVITIYYYVL